VSEDALRSVLDATASDLLAYFERRARVRDDAADLLAETMLHAWRRVASMPDEPERRRMWLFTIAANVLANQRRSYRRRTALVQKVRGNLFAPPEADQAETLSVRAAVLALADAHRELVMLIHWDGLTLVEAAEVLGLNPSTARGRYATARSILRDALAEVSSVV